MLFYLLLAFIILLGIVGAICCIEKDRIKGSEVEYNADEFEIIELKS